MKWCWRLILARRRRPARPFFHAADFGDAAPHLGVFADGDAVADRLVVRQHVVEELVVAIDDDRARSFLAVEADEMPAIGLGDRRLRVGQVRHQLLVARLPGDLSRRLKRLLHAAAEHQAHNQKCYRTHGHGHFPPTPLTPARRNAPIPITKSRCSFQPIRRLSRIVGAECGRNAALSSGSFG